MMSWPTIHKLLFKLTSTQAVIGFVTNPHTFWILVPWWPRGYVYWYLASIKNYKVSRSSHFSLSLYLTGPAISQLQVKYGIKSSLLCYEVICFTFQGFSLQIRIYQEQRNQQWTFPTREGACLAGIPSMTQIIICCHYSAFAILRTFHVQNIAEMWGEKEV